VTELTFQWLNRFFSFDEVSFEEGSLPSEEELQLGAISMLVEVANGKGELAEPQLTSVEDFFDSEYGSQARAVVQETIALHSIEQQELALEQLLSFLAVAFNGEQKMRLTAILIRVLQPDVGDELEQSPLLSQFAEAAGISDDLLESAHALLKQVMEG